MRGTNDEWGIVKAYNDGKLTKIYEVRITNDESGRLFSSIE